MDASSLTTQQHWIAHTRLETNCLQRAHPHSFPRSCHVTRAVRPDTVWLVCFRWTFGVQLSQYSIACIFQPRQFAHSANSRWSAQPSPFTMQSSGGDSSVADSQKRPKMCHIFCRWVPFMSAHYRSQLGSMTSDLIDQPDAVLENRVEGGTKDAVCGLHRIRVGEASNPGPRTLFFRK